MRGHRSTDAWSTAGCALASDVGPERLRPAPDPAARRVVRVVALANLGSSRGDRAIVAVDSAYGSRKASAGPSGPDVIADLLLGELVREHLARGR